MRSLAMLAAAAALAGCAELRTVGDATLLPAARAYVDQVCATGVAGEIARAELRRYVYAGSGLYAVADCAWRPGKTLLEFEGDPALPTDRPG